MSLLEGTAMDQYKLKALLCAIETGSLNRAAEKLHCTQSGLSQLMNGVEQELGFKILERTHRGIGLTKEGQELYPFLLDMEGSYSLLEEKTRRIREGRKRPLRIGAFSSMANLWLPSILKEYKGRHESLLFDIRVGTDIIHQWLTEGKIDIAFGDDRRCRGFSFIPLQKDRYEAVLPPSFLHTGQKEITRDELIAYPLLMAPMNDLTYYLDIPPRKDISVTCDDDYTLLSMVKAGLGATAMPHLSLSRLPEGVLCLPLVPEVHRTLGIALPLHPTKEAEDLASFACSWIKTESSFHAGH